jgi:hypothetical protein
MIGGIAGAIAGVIAIVAAFAIVFTVARKRHSNQLSEPLELDPACRQVADGYEETEDFSYEHVNPDIETYQGEIGFTTAGTDDLSDD